SDENKHAVENLEFEVRSQRSRVEQQVLLSNIMKLIEKEEENSMEITTIYRDVDLAHYPELIGPDNKLCGTLKPKQRTKSGHPTNIAFNRGGMIYFNTSNKKLYSFYGPHRITLSPYLIFGPNTILYFVDMHCYPTDTGAHYITLATAEKGSSLNK
ncbi:hypothetical protein PMAYCL1PPCAC_22977, partial [Pristionchus mayeri]